MYGHAGTCTSATCGSLAATGFNTLAVVVGAVSILLLGVALLKAGRPVRHRSH